MSTVDWQTIVSEKRAALYAKIPAAWRLVSVPDANELRNCVEYPRQFLSARAYAITETTDAQVLLNEIANGVYTAFEVAEAFCHRAAIAQQLVNCLSEIMFDEALQRAKQLDEYLRTYKKTIGPLHGLPISLKDSFRVQGTNSAIGLVSFLDVLDTPETESLAVKELRDLGAVLYVKTTVPTAVSHIDCHNNVTGQTFSPANRLMSSGGSSGGEGALSAIHGSIIGLSTDIGGSSRVPAAVNGVYGLRTCHGRLPYLGVKDLINGNISSPFTVGPMGAKLSNLTLLMQVILSRQPWLRDPKVIELPWRHTKYEEVLKRASAGGLVFGIMASDGVVTPQPPILRALKELQVRLEGAGHEVVPWAPSHVEVAKITGALFTAEGGVAIHKALSASGEPPNKLVKDYFGEAPRKGLTAAELFDENELRYQYQQAYTEYWNNSARLTKSGRVVDFVLLPAFPASSFRPGQSGTYLGYTTVGNCLDYTAAIVPVSHVDKTIDVPSPSFVALDKRDQTVQSLYNPDDFDGAPISVQIMGRRLEEERVLAAATVVDGLLRTTSSAVSLL